VTDSDVSEVSSVEELRRLVGQETRIGTWVEITQEQVNAFAEATGDHQWIHVDPERAKRGPYGGTIAHGFFTLSVCGQLLRGAEGVQVRLPTKMGVNYGLNRVRFPSAVPVGKRVRARSKLLSVEEVQPGVIQQVQEVTVDVEGERKPAMVAETVTRLYL